MGAALWLRAAAADAVALPSGMPHPEAGCRYRIEVLGEPRAPWRASPAEAMADAITLDLASWDGERREHFLAVPVDMKVVMPERRLDPRFTDLARSARPRAQSRATGSCRCAPCPTVPKAYSWLMSDHLDSPSPHRGPYADLSDEGLAAAYERVAADPDDATAALLLAELEHRGIATGE